LLLSETSLEKYKIEAGPRFRQFYGTDRRGQALRGKALALWCLGHADAALAMDDEQRALAEADDNSFELAYALGLSSLLQSLRQDFQRMQTFACRSIKVARAGGYRFRELRATLFLRMAEAWESPRLNKIEVFDKAIMEYQATGNRMGESALLASLGELWGRAGKVRKGHAAIARALDYAQRSGERFAEAELHRVKGNLHVLAGEHDEAEASFRTALTIAAAQQARSWTLRASLSLAGYRRAQGNNEELTQILGPICSWFAQQSSLPELAQARLLLANYSA
jgi:predicted ATPase